jgi:hypothetical protein
VTRSTRILLSIFGALLFLCCVAGLGLTVLGVRLGPRGVGQVLDPPGLGGGVGGLAGGGGGGGAPGGGGRPPGGGGGHP